MESTYPHEINISLKRDYFNRRYIFQPLIFKGQVSFRGSKPLEFAQLDARRITMTCFKNDYGCVTADIGNHFKEFLQTFDIIRYFSSWLQLCNPKKIKGRIVCLPKRWHLVCLLLRFLCLVGSFIQRTCFGWRLLSTGGHFSKMPGTSPKCPRENL